MSPTEDLLPHFNVKFMLEMRAHVRKRVLESEVLIDKGWAYSVIDGMPRLMIDRASKAEADAIARQMVCRIYRTQLREAKGVISFSDAMIDWNNKHNPAAQLNKPGQGDGGKAFEKVVNKVRRSFGAGALQEKY